MTQSNQRKVNCSKREGGFIATFDAMASPCEVLIDTADEGLAKAVGQLVAEEAWRIQDKYSRYDKNSFCSELNRQSGKVTAIDEETYQLLLFAEQCYQLSDGLFDITSGVLGRVWRFDGSDNLPNQSDITAIMPLVGWRKTQLTETQFTMVAGQQIDFGGIGKEYAVDKALAKAQTLTQHPMLINFGGDLATTGARENDQPWVIGIEHPGLTNDKSMLVSIKQGALATSGDANRYLLCNGQRYSHILNIRTGWPIENPPKSITVAAPQCTQAGLLATLALLQGGNAEAFLTEHQIKFWAIR